MRDKSTLAYLLPVLFIVLVSVCAPYMSFVDPYGQDLGRALQAPDSTYWLGTDQYGRDMLSRVLAGAQTTVFSALILLCIITVWGSLIGIISAYCGGRVDSALMRVTDVFLAFPELVFAVAVAAVLGGGLMNAALALAFVAWPKYARVSRSLTLGIREMPYIKIAQINGTSRAGIVKDHILPNIAGPMLVTAALDIGTIIMELAGLSFLGLGAMPPTAEWGAMMNNGRSMIQTAPWVVISPGCAIFLTVAAFNLLGDKLRDTIDPRQRKY